MLKKFWIGISGLVLISAMPAYAVSTLKRVQVDAGQVDLFFDEKIDRNQIKTEFVGDIIQISLQDVSVYPAKVMNLSNGDVTKIFAYQYAPRLVRTRLSVKGKAEDYKNRIAIRPNGKTISIRLDGAAAHEIAAAPAVVSAAAPRRPDARPAVAAPQAPQPSEDEKRLLERVLKGSGSDAEAQAAAAPSEKESAKPAKVQAEPAPLTKAGKSKSNPASTTLTDGKAEPSLWRGFAMLGIVLGLFGAIVWVIRRAKKANDGVSKWVSKMIPSARNPKMIEVIQTHHLGPKKSIAVVKIAGQTLVLGITAESINLISTLAADGSKMESVPSLTDLAEKEIAEPSAEDLAIEDFFAQPSARSPRISSDQLARGVVSRPTPDASKAVISAKINEEPSLSPAPVIGARGAIAAAYAQNAFTATLDAEKAKPSVRDQIKSRIEGMKPL
jgi:flagellar protein FliO/FliZ